MSDVKGREWSCDLPRDTFRLILSNLVSTNDLMQFGAVCKKWRLAMMEYRKNSVLGHGGQCWLVKKRTESDITMYHPLNKNICCRITDILHIRCASILCSKDGWLLMNRGPKVFFLNPLSNFTIELPNLPLSGLRFTSFTITSAPTSKDWQVCGLRYQTIRKKFGIFTICHGEKEWTRTLCTVPEGYFHPEETNPVYHMGKFYFLFARGKVLGVFDPINRSWKLLNTTKGLGAAATDYYLLECDGDLVVVFNSIMKGTVSVRKLDESRMIWNEIKDIGEYAFFLSHKTSYAKRSTSNCMRNKLFFPCLHEDYGVFYCLEKGSYETFHNEFSIKNLMNATFILECCWMDASQHDLSSANECPEAISFDPRCTTSVESDTDDEDDDSDYENDENYQTDWEDEKCKNIRRYLFGDDNDDDDDTGEE